MTEYDQLAGRLISVEAKLDMLIGQMASGLQDHEARIRVLEQRVDPSHVDSDHETRLRTLERAWWRSVGAAGAGGGLLGSLVTWLLTGGVGP